MSTFCGFYVMDSSGQQAKGLGAACRSVIAGAVGPARAAEFSSGRFFIAYDGTNMRCRKNEYGVAMASGQVLAENCASIDDDLDALSSALATGRLPDALSKSRGNFVAISWTRDDDSVVFMTDCLATRPLYYHVGGGAMVFASCLAHLQKLVPNLMLDPEGVCEEAAFGYSLSTRTPYRGVVAAQAAEIIRCAKGGLVSSAYWDWRRAVVTEETELSKLSKSIYDEFVEGVRRRAERYSAKYCTLSGGMDTRTIAFTLASLGFSPTKISFGSDDSLDRAIAGLLAPLLPGRHIVKAVDAIEWAAYGGTAKIIGSIIGEVEPAAAANVPVWTGDGGDVGLGADFVTDELCHLCEQGKFDVASQRFTARRRLSRLFKPIGNGDDFVARQVRQEFEKFDIPNRSQIMYRFLLINDQRRHLHKYHEETHSTGIELVTPFFDFAYLKKVLMAPAVEMVGHRLYSKVFDHLPAAARSVPWQTYPGHIKCPLPLPMGAEQQWGRKRLSQDNAALKKKCTRLMAAALSKQWPASFIRRLPTFVAAAAVYCGVDRSYLTEQAWRVLIRAER